MALLELTWSEEYSPAVKCRLTNLEVPEDIAEGSSEEYFASMVLALLAVCLLAVGCTVRSDMCRA